jgi:sortase (surface protein transpeptidase)
MTLRHTKKAIGHLLLGVAFGALLVSLWPQHIQAPVHDEMSVQVVSLEKSQPVLLRIPKISLEATFESPLGLAQDGSIAVPEGFDTVGWYKHGPTPGEMGPAVVLGHVDSVDGPAVFFSLGQLEVGDEVYIMREDGSEGKFVIERKERYLQSEFPTKEVYGDISYPGLRLVTCSGTYKKGEQRYTHNLVVYGRLVE